MTKKLWTMTIGFLVAIALCAGSARATTVVRRVNTVSVRISTGNEINRHLHLAPPAAKGKGGKPLAAKKVSRIVHPHWHRRWDFVHWVGLHRGLGTVSGVVRNAQGAPAGGVRLALRHPDGRVFGNNGAKHVVRTGPAGSFVMRNVRAGSYRIIASVGKKVSHAQIQLFTGTVAQVSLGI